MANDRTIYVYADWDGLQDAPVLMGTLTGIHSKGKEIFSFEYTPEWLAASSSRLLDPNLQYTL